MSASRAKKKRRQRAGAKGGGAAKVAGTRPSRLDVRDGVARPKPVWAPFPLTEIGLVAGIVMFGGGVASANAYVVSIGALVLAVVVGELCLREHFAGFRSHTLLLAALPVAIAHGVVVFAITDRYRGPVSLAVDLALGGALAWFLRERYRAARERSRAA